MRWAVFSLADIFSAEWMGRTSIVARMQVACRALHLHRGGNHAAHAVGQAGHLQARPSGLSSFSAKACRCSKQACSN